jgi:hypothetical protein
LAAGTGLKFDALQAGEMFQEGITGGGEEELIPGIGQKLEKEGISLAGAGR